MIPWPEPDPSRALAGGAQEDLRRRAVRVLLEEVVLDGPCVVEPQAIGQLDLAQRVLQHLILALLTPRPGNLHFVEDPELHARSPLTGLGWDRRRDPSVREAARLSKTGVPYDGRP